MASTQTLVLEPEAQSSALGRRIKIIAFPNYAPVAEGEDVVEEQRDCFCGGDGALEMGGIEHRADFDGAVAGLDVHERYEALWLVRCFSEICRRARGRIDVVRSMLGGGS